MSDYAAAGFSGALSKPFTIAGLGRLLHQLLGERVAEVAGTQERGRQRSGKRERAHGAREV